MGNTQINRIVNNKINLLNHGLKNINHSLVEPFQKTNGLVMNTLTYEWICRSRANDTLYPVSAVIHEKSLEVAKKNFRPE